MSNNQNTIEDTPLKTNVRELIKFSGFVITAAAFVWSIKMDIKDLSAESQTDKKVTEIRLQTIELRLTQLEQEQKEFKQQREAELQRKAEQQ